MEMRGTIKHITLFWLRCLSIVIFLTMLTSIDCGAQLLKKYKVKNGKMYIELSKDIKEADLKEYISKYDLENLALLEFIKKGFRDSINNAGWQIELNTPIIFILSKTLGAYNDIDNPVERILFAGNHFPFNSGFPAIANNQTVGYNKFKNKSPFKIVDSAVFFFLRNNLNANKVMLAGSFNNWLPDKLQMIKTDSGWVASVKLMPGKYWYKFIVDGEWMSDKDNQLKENDGEGNINSVFYYTNYVFKLNGYIKARKVFVSGSFNQWEERELLMTKTPGGWVLPVYLPEGTYTYRFIADGKWFDDPSNPNRYPNEFGEYNSFITLGKPHMFYLNGYMNAHKVVLAGSFNNWRNDELFMTKTANGWEFPYVLRAGNYTYKFIVDGKSIVDPANPPAQTNNKEAPSVLILDPNYTFHLKGFDKATSVYLAGEFNNWDPASLPMMRVNDEWVFTVHLSPGKHLYKFIVDGNWIMDPGNKLWEQNEHNTGNSVLWVEK